MSKPLILVVEDDVPVRNLITITLKTHGQLQVSSLRYRMYLRHYLAKNLSTFGICAKHSL